MDILGNLRTIGAFLVMLGLVVFVHEFGHFAVAKLLRMRVFVFSFGFGRRLLGFKWGDTDCRLSLLPLGGYVRLEGEPEDPLTESGDDPSLETRALADGTLVQVANPDYFTNRPRWQRIAVYVAGPLMNAVLTIAILSVFFMIGFRVAASYYDQPVVGVVNAGSPAEAAGVRPGDRILSVDGQEVENWESIQYVVLIRPDARFKVRIRRADGDHEFEVRSQAVMGKDKIQLGDLGWSPLVRVGELSKDGAATAAGLQIDDGLLAMGGEAIKDFGQFRELIQASGGKPLELKVWRADTPITLEVTPRQTPGGYLLGIGEKTVLKHFGPVRSIREATARTWTMTRQALDTLGRLATGKLSPKALSGPIGIAKASGEAAKEGPFQYFLTVAFISLQVGLLNLILPFIPFDGGHLALLVTESVMRRDLSARARDWVMNAGFGFVVLLIAVVFYSDLSKIAFFSRFLP
jgi:regulator of sigma E protease